MTNPAFTYRGIKFQIITIIAATP